jgi:hypothetical protein
VTVQQVHRELHDDRRDDLHDPAASIDDRLTRWHAGPANTRFTPTGRTRFVDAPNAPSTKAFQKTFPFSRGDGPGPALAFQGVRAEPSREVRP